MTKKEIDVCYKKFAKAINKSDKDLTTFDLMVTFPKWYEKVILKRKNPAVDDSKLADLTDAWRNYLRSEGFKVGHGKGKVDVKGNFVAQSISFDFDPSVGSKLSEDQFDEILDALEDIVLNFGFNIDGYTDFVYGVELFLK